MDNESNAHVTVSLPFHGCPQMLRRAVLSILGQTHTELTLVVVNDGAAPPWEALADVDDPRLVRFDLMANQGRYFADAVVLNATRSPYFLVQDADDWSEPHRVASLLRRLRDEPAAGALSASLRHHVEKRGTAPSLEACSGLDQPLSREIRHRANHHGLFRVDALRAVGGYYGGFRMGYDTLLINFLLMSSRLVSVDEPLYHRTIHRASLTNAPATGLRSTARRRAADALARMYGEAFSAYTRYRQRKIDRESLCAAIRRIAKSRITPEQQTALDRETLRLREALGGGGQRISSEAGPAVSLLDAPDLAWSGWALEKSFAGEIAQHLESQRPRRMLEIGSGSSTVLLADYAARHGASLVSLEHDPAFFDQTDALLRSFGLRDRVDLKLASLKPYRCPNGRRYPWYAVDLDGPFDFVLADGPPERFGRQAVVFALAPHLAEGWQLWLHDALRPHEQGCVALWRRYFSFDETLSSTDPRGAVLLQGRGELHRMAPRERSLGITLLTGGRLPLLRRTIDSLLAHCLGLLETHPVVAFLNGDDPETQAYLDELPFIDEHLRHAGSVLPIGTATSLLMEALARRGGIETILHLEDDWVVETNDTSWLERAHCILDEHPRIGQVRLRHKEEKVLAHHMVTGRPISWERREGFLLSRSAHFTFNPSLVRIQDVPAIYPCTTEREAQERFLSARYAAAQLVPGAFRHIGTHQSRREQMAGERWRPRTVPLRPEAQGASAGA